MNRIKTELHNWLWQERLDTQIRIGGEGVNIIEFNTDPYIEKWYAKKYDTSMEPNLEIILQSIEVLILQLQVVIKPWILRQLHCLT